MSHHGIAFDARGPQRVNTTLSDDNVPSTTIEAEASLKNPGAVAS